MSRKQSKKKTGARVAKTRIARIWEAFDYGTLRRVCQMQEDDFADAFGLDTFRVRQSWPDDFYAFRDNGARVLAVAHLDTVADPAERGCKLLNTEAGAVVFSRALDDRLGAYIILDMLPKLGIPVDVLLTTGEEMGRSTASFFETEKPYDWIIEFDRGGTDVVMYQFEDADLRAAVIDAGARCGEGSFSDICDLEHLGVKALNWGVGYREYHTDRSHVFLDDTFEMLERFMVFFEDNDGIRMPHRMTDKHWFGRYRYASEYPAILGKPTETVHSAMLSGDPDGYHGLGWEEIADREDFDPDEYLSPEDEYAEWVRWNLRTHESEFRT